MLLWSATSHLGGDMGTRLALLLSLAIAAPSLGCGNDEPTPQPYGGQVLVFHDRLPDDTDVLRLSAYFIAAQDPEVAAEVTLGECGPDPRTAAADNRQYFDVGDSVTFHLGGGDFVVPRLVSDPDSDSCTPGAACADGVMDFYGLMHEVAYLNEVTAPELGDGFLMGEDSVTTADPQSFSDQLRVMQPPTMEVDSPALSSDSVTLILSSDHDLELTWQQSEPVDDLTVNITFAPSDATVATTCRVPDTGSFTVPHELIAGLEGDSGDMTVYSVSRSTAMTDSGRAIDVLAEYHGNFHPWQRTTSTSPAR